MQPHEGVSAGGEEVQAAPALVLGRGLAREGLAFVSLPSCQAVKCVLGAPVL